MTDLDPNDILRKKTTPQLKGYVENLEQLVEERTKALKESEAKQQAILSAIGDLITIQNKDLDIIWINQQERAIYGDVIGRKCYEAYKGLDAPCPNCTVEIVFNEEKTVISEGMIIHPDGRPIHILTTSSPMRDAEGNIVAVVEVVKDITERKQLEMQLKDYTENLEKTVEERTEALKESEEKLSAILMGIGDHITIQNKDLDIIWVNQSIKDVWGDVIGKKCYEAYKGLDEPCPVCGVEKVFNEGKIIVLESVDRLPDGGQVQVLITSSPVRDAEGNIVAVVDVAKDITERINLENRLKDYTENLEKLVEERTKALKESEARLQAILTGIGDRISIESKDLDVLWVNQPVKDLWGDVIGKKCYKVFKGLDAPCPECDFETVLNEAKTIVAERTSILPDGQRSHTLVTSSPMRNAEGNIIAIVDVVKDITERKKVEEALRRAEQRYRNLFEEAPVMYVITQNQNDGPIIVGCNELFLSNLGYTRTEILGQPLADFYTPESRIKLLEDGGYKDALEGQFVAQERELVTRDGRIIKTLLQAVPEIDSDGNLFGTRAMYIDITERKLAEEALRESEEKYSTIVEKGNDGIAIIQDGVVKFVNPKMLEIANLSLEDLLEKPFINFVAPEYRKFIIDRNKKRISGEEVPSKYETEILLKDGRKVPLETSANIIEYEGRAATMAIIRDITERKKIDQMKTNFINTAAHELRTPLSALKAHVDLLDMKSKDITLPEDINRKIGIIARNADRLSVLINNLLDYTRLEAGTIKLRLELGSLESVAVQAIKEVLPLAQKHGHKLDLITPKPLPFIYMDKEIIHTIFSNLLSNAIKYTSDGGEIHVTIMDKEGNLHITVKDTGIGIAEEDFEKIFQPFHVAEIPASARFQSEFERTGLGLAITKEYVKMHGGSIWVESRIGEGSTFHVVLPIENR